MREEFVGLGPRGRYLGRDGVAEHRRDGADEVRADNRVVLGHNVERHVLLRDRLDRRPERAEVVDVRRISSNGSREGLRLLGAP